MARRLLKEHIKILFAETKKSPYWEKIKKLPVTLRYLVGVFLMLFGILGMFTPIPAGVVFFVIWLALCIWLRRARAWIIGFVHITRLHLLYSKIYMWWQMHKR
jgi:hypothetical protein